MAKPGMHETPLLRVSRPVSACSRCRSAKIRCDGKLPACTACERSNRASECSSANDQFAKGKERSYVAALESRIEKLEKKLAQSKSRKPSVSMTGMGSPEADGTSQALSRRAAKRREAADMEELISDFGYMSVNATTRDFYGFTSTMSFSRLVLSASTVHNIPSRALPLPVRYLAMPLINDYLQNIFTTLPFFSETSIFASIDAVYQHNGQNASDLDFWTVNMILAIASSLRSRAHGDTEYRNAEGYLAAALRRADEVVTPGSITGIQAILLLVVYAMLDPAHFDSWYLIGIACRAVVDIGLHHDPPKQAMPNKAHLERRRRVFYCVYTLDRSISMVHARAFSFTDASMSVALPSLSSKPNVYGPPGNGQVGQVWQQPVDAALHLFRFRLIESSWYQTLFMSGRTPMDKPSSYIFGLLKEMSDWAEAIPESVPPIIKDLFKLESLYGKTYCLAPSGKVHTICDIGRLLSFEYSIAYMDILQPISKSRDSAAFFSFHDSLKVYFIGNLLLETLWLNEEQIIGGQPSTILYRPGPNESPVPPLPDVSRSGNAARAINCINQMLDVLQTYSRRWEQAAALHAKFRSESAVMLASLTRRMENNVELRIGYNGADRPYSEERGYGLDLDSMLQEEWQRTVEPETNQNGQPINISSDTHMTSSANNGVFQYP